MIKELQKKFITVAMCSTFAVLFVIVGILNAANFYRIIKDSDRLLDMLAENDGRFPDDVFGRHKALPEDEIKKPLHAYNIMTPETPYETRFFSIWLDENDSVISVDTGKIAAIVTDEAVEYVNTVIKKNKSRGFVDEYRYSIYPKNSDRIVIFVYKGQELVGAKKLLITSMGVSAAGLLAVFVLVVIFSGKVFMPVEESYRRQKQFVTDAGHELKTPLAIILSDVDIIEMENGEGKWTQSIRNQIERLTRLTEQMVSLSKMDEGEKDWKMCDFSLKDALSGETELFEPLYIFGKKSMQVTLPKSACILNGDEGLIRQLISLLLDNALKYSDENGQIRVCLTEERSKGRRYKLTVWNTVSDIPEGNLDILFERFYRLDSSRNSQTGGSGIGLSLAKSIVSLHRGRITAYSEDGKSVCFEVRL